MPATIEAVSEAEVRRVAELAHLELSDAETVRMQRDLNAILGHIAQLNELDTTDVPAMAQVGGSLDEEAGRDVDGVELRSDQVAASVDRKAVLAAAPESDGRFFKVPKVIER